MALKNLLPLFFLTLFVAVLAAVGYVVYSIVQDVSKNTREKMERKHVVFSKDGMKVEVKEIKDEEYKDRSQRLVTLSRHVPVFVPSHQPGTKILVFESSTNALRLVSSLTCGTTLPFLPTRVVFGI